MRAWLDFEQIKREADFAAILAHYGIVVRGRGPQIKVLCPFHKEQKPSLSVNLAERIFHCFGCAAKGNAIDFVLLKEGGSIRAAAAKVAELCGIDAVAEKGGARRAARPVGTRQGPGTTNDRSSCGSAWNVDPLSGEIGVQV